MTTTAELAPDPVPVVAALRVVPPPPDDARSRAEFLALTGAHA